MKNRIILAIILSLATWVIITGIAFGATLKANSINASVKVGSDSDFTFYLDPAAGQPVINITLPDVPAGGTSAFTVYVKNTSTAAKIISAGTDTVPASAGTLLLTFDGQTQEVLQPGAIAKVVGTFNADANTAASTVNFTFSVNSADATTTATTVSTTNTSISTTITPTGTTSTTVKTTTTITTVQTTVTTTSTTPTIAAVSYSKTIQPILNQDCTRCHSSGSINFSSYSTTKSLVVPGNAASSTLYLSVNNGSMSRYMTAAQVKSLADWINQGAPNN